MKCRKRLEIEHPKNAFGALNVGCPDDYGYAEVPEWCGDQSKAFPSQCRACWDREVSHNSNKIVIDGQTYAIFPWATTVRIPDEQKLTGWIEKDGNCGIVADLSAYVNDGELATNLRRAINLWLGLSRFSAERQKEKIETIKPYTKYYISLKLYSEASLDSNGEEKAIFEVRSDRYMTPLFNVCFDSSEAAHEALIKYQDELIWFLRDFKPTMRF